MIAQVQIRNVYGEEKIYPADAATRIFAEIAGTKTLTRQTISRIKALGYVVEVVNAQPVTL